MKKFLTFISFTLVILINLSLLIYAFIKASDAEKAAEESYQRAKRFEKLATVRAAEAQRTKLEADELRTQLENCK